MAKDTRIDLGRFWAGPRSAAHPGFCRPPTSPSMSPAQLQPEVRGPLIDALPPDHGACPCEVGGGPVERREFLKLAAAPCLATCIAACLPAEVSAAHGYLLPDDPADGAVEAGFYRKLGSQVVECGLCPRQCVVAEGQRGYCRVRENRRGTYYTLTHSQICAAHIDPIEKKPFFHFRPGTLAFSVATGGCNVNCKFCQNWEIAQVRLEELRRQHLAPHDLAALAVQNGCPNLAYTYSEPIIGTEYYLDAAEAGHRLGIKSVFVSNGFIRQEPLQRLCDRMDAIKVDLKAFSEQYYRDVVNAELKPVQQTLLTLRQRGVWSEIVYLVVPTLNDGDAELRAMAKWVRSELGADMPIHFSRFYPLYRLKNLPPTPLETLERAKAICDAEGLHYVYLGNVPGHPAENTYCPKCRRVVIERIGLMARQVLVKQGKCPFCQQPIPGVWT